MTYFCRFFLSNFRDEFDIEISVNTVMFRLMALIMWWLLVAEIKGNI